MRDFVKELGIEDINQGAFNGQPMETGGKVVESISPIDGGVIAKIKQANADDYEKVVKTAADVFPRWRAYPAPKRGELVRLMGLALREKKEALGKLVTLEMGKIAPEGMGEVQEMIDIADFAVGLSRQLYGLTMPSERPQHSMYEQWHPLGCVGIVSAFNFPVAVWAWNAFIAAACGDTMVWKPSSKTPLTAIAVQRIVDRVLAEHGFEGVMGLVVGSGRDVGELMLHDKRVPLVSATGSCKLGKHVGTAVAERFGSTILELGGNNAIIAMEDVNLDLLLPAVLFGAVGTAGQRCTTTRRLLLHKDIFANVSERLVEAYKQIRIGDPLAAGTVMGPMVDRGAVEEMQAALVKVKEQGGEVLYGGGELSGDAYPGGCYVEPCLVKAKNEMPIVQDETFAPILYLIEVEDIDQAIAVQNDVPQGLSSAIFTESMRYAHKFLSEVGSDCGIANVNIGTSGAEIGGAFGGEKETGGGREAGSDSWKAYMRRQTQTVNWSTELPLAQGIKFG